MSLIEKAITLALKYHEGQVYADGVHGEPYVLHPLRVMIGLGVEHEETTLAAAVLHDVMEDCGVTRDDLLSAGMSIEVVELVEVLTRRKDAETYMEYIGRVGKNANARAIKLIDLNTNLNHLWRLPEDKTGRLQKRYFEARDYLTYQWNEEIKQLYAGDENEQ